MQGQASGATQPPSPSATSPAGHTQPGTHWGLYCGRGRHTQCPGTRQTLALEGRGSPEARTLPAGLLLEPAWAGVSTGRPQGPAGVGSLWSRAWGWRSLTQSMSRVWQLFWQPEPAAPGVALRQSTYTMGGAQTVWEGGALRGPAHGAPTCVSLQPRQCCAHAWNMCLCTRVHVQDVCLRPPDTPTLSPEGRACLAPTLTGTPPLACGVFNLKFHGKITKGPSLLPRLPPPSFPHLGPGCCLRCRSVCPACRC